MARPIRWWSAGLSSLPADESWVDGTEATRFASMRFNKRRNEAMLARYTAKVTLAMARELPVVPHRLTDVTVRNASDGAPEAWIDGQPADLVLAMTDRADWAVAAVLEGRDRIGCDLELVEPRSPAFIRDWFTDAEQALVANSPEPDLTANLVWSAKESALKVLRTGLRRPTRSVEVQLGSTGETWSSLEVHGHEGVRMPGWWIRYGSFVLTVAAVVDTAEPVSLEDPPPLAEASPAHSWLDAPRLD